MKRITGHLEEKSGRYYAAVNNRDANGKRRVKWYNLNLDAKKGNKRKAEELLNALLDELNAGFDTVVTDLKPAERECLRLANSPAEEYLSGWIEDHRRNITVRTYEGYRQYLFGRIIPFFQKEKLILKDISGDHLNKFYRELFEEGLKGATIQRIHSIIHLAFKAAVKRGVIPFNPCDRAERPKAQPFIASYYNAEEIKQLLEVASSDELHLVILLTAYYGLRRSEVLGLKWSAIDFTEKKICIRHKVIEEYGEPVGYDVMKTKSSYRTLPLLPQVEEELKKQMDFTKQMKKAFRKGYCTDYEDYVCVNAVGKLYNPDYVTDHFACLLKQNGMRHIRFHELRHSCASLLLAKKVPMKMIQDWLGHSDIQTTSNIYSHLDSESKLESAGIIASALEN